MTARDAGKEDKIMRGTLLISLMLLMAWMNATAWAGHKHYDPADAIYDQLVNGATGVRYPGDVATPVGNYHVRGGKKIPYVERCHWMFDINQLGLPTHFKQVCRRYYGRPVK